jgi:myo-inositol-1-phosphate synthase
VPYAGSDGKTGETLLVSALAPMFTARALRVRSWSGTNLLGGGDGATLADAGAAVSKTSSKRRGLVSMLGHDVDGAVHIDNVPEQGEWKTAWDHVAFEGFLGVRMVLQTTWQGCDSALAAPLVLDLARLLARAHEAGVVGPFAPAAFFFKDPLAAHPGAPVEYRLGAQFDELVRWAASLENAP